MKPGLLSTLLLTALALAPRIGLAQGIEGDGDGDGDVDAADYGVWRSNFGATGTDDGAATGDYNGDGTVDAADYVVWKSNFGNTAPAADVTTATTAPVPEPTVLTQGLNTPLVSSQGLLSGIQDGGIEIRSTPTGVGGPTIADAPADGAGVGPTVARTPANAGGETGPTRPRDPAGGEDRGDPIDDSGGDDPSDEPLPEHVCGPDVTAAYVEALNRAFERIQQLSDDEKGSFDGAAFLYRNGANVDQTPRPLTLEGEEGGARCPRGACEQTFTLAGHCLSRHISNDIMYGFVAYLLDVPYSIAWSGAQAWDLLQYGGMDPQTSNAAYTLGWNMAGWMEAGKPMSEPVLGRHLERTHLVEGGLLGADLVTLLEIVHRDEPYVLQCAPCPEPCTSDFMKDFSKTTWTLEDGSRVTYGE
jgi:hypothetical protein